MARRKKTRAEEPRGTVILEFFDERDGSDQFTMELSQEEFERYEAIAANLGTLIEEFMADIAARELRERSTQWVIPTLDAFGRVTLEGGTPMDLSNIAGTSSKRRSE